jgi:hypothetical protein
MVLNLKDPKTYEETPRSHEYVQQSNRIQSQYTEIRVISIDKRWSKENNTIYNNFKTK